MKKRFVLVGLLVVTSVWLAAGKARTLSGSGLVEKQFEAWNAHDADSVASFYTDDVVYEDVTYGMVAHGHAEMRKLAANFFATVPDLKLEVVHSSLENGRGCVEWVFSGTDVGIYKTGKKFSVRGASVFEMRGRKFSSNKDFYDSGTIMRQVGVLPEVKDSTSSSPR
jgi:steroid delta-isomerase-like uncharacterized protein